MKNRSFLYLIAFAAFILAVGLACAALSPTPTAEPVSNPPTQAVQPPTSESPSATTSPGTGSDLVTFTDQNNYYQIDLPGDWKHTESSGDHYYIDTFTSGDGKAVVENIAYDDGTAFNGSENGKFALQILNQNYIVRVNRATSRLPTIVFRKMAANALLGLPKVEAIPACLILKSGIKPLSLCSRLIGAMILRASILIHKTRLFRATDFRNLVAG